jgi:hypothetical protein
LDDLALQFDVSKKKITHFDFKLALVEIERPQTGLKFEVQIPGITL